jgi:GAF domain-containing protein
MTQMSDSTTSNTSSPVTAAELTRKIAGCTTLDALLGTVLDAAIALHRADYGNIQLYRGGELVIAKHRGFKENFLTRFRRVSVDDDSACGQALREGRPVVIADVMADKLYAPFRKIAADAGYRAVQSTPLITSTGTFVGMISTHFATAHAPSKQEMAETAIYATLLADAVQKFVAAALFGDPLLSA